MAKRKEKCCQTCDIHSTLGTISSAANVCVTDGGDFVVVGDNEFKTALETYLRIVDRTARGRERLDKYIENRKQAKAAGAGK